MFGPEKYHAIRVDPGKCYGCTHCMQVCPTEAIRVRNGLAVISGERCVDCGNCMRACPADAFYIAHDDISIIHRFRYKVALFPSVMIGQFPEYVTDDQVYGALIDLGFTHVFEVEQPIQWIVEAYRSFHAKHWKSAPLISSFCPAVVRLIQIRYPTLIDNIMMVKAPHDLAAHYTIARLKQEGATEEDIGIFYIAPCSAKIAAIKQPLGEKKSIVDGIINMNELYNKVMKVISTTSANHQKGFREYLTREGILWCLPRGESRLFKRKAMAIDGIHNVVKMLEQIETGSIPEIEFLELRSCDHGCAGGILLSGNRFLTVERLSRRARNYPRCSEKSPTGPDKEKILSRMAVDPIEPAQVFLIDENREKAVHKLAQTEQIFSLLPAIDCGACGTPNCRALAEDIIRGTGKMSDCVFHTSPSVSNGTLSSAQAKTGAERIWGEDRFLNRVNRLKKGKK